MDEDEINDFERKRKEEYLNYLQNKKPDNRYMIQDIGYGFIVVDRFRHMNRDDNRPVDYLLINKDMRGSERDERYLSLNDFSDLLNGLDRQVNKGLYKDNKEFLLSKDIVYDKLLAQIEGILNNLEEKNNDQFKVTYYNYLKEWDSSQAISIQGTVYRDLLQEYGYHHGTLYDNKIFLTLMKTINRKLDYYKDTVMRGVLEELKQDILTDLRRGCF